MSKLIQAQRDLLETMIDHGGKIYAFPFRQTFTKAEETRAIKSGAIVERNGAYHITDKGREMVKAPTSPPA